MNKIPIDHSVVTLPGSLATLPAMFVIVTIALTLLGLIATALWVWRLKSRVLGLSSNSAKREKVVVTMAAELDAQAMLARQMSMDLEELRKRLFNQEDTNKSESPLWTTSSAPVNLNRRGQILRLSRKGKSVAEIAQDLNVAQGEVELMLKVHDLGQQVSP